MIQPNTRKIFALCAAVAAFWLIGRPLLPVFTPFVPAAALALAAQPLVRFLCARLRLPRAVASAMGVSIALLAVLAAAVLLGALAVRQLGNLSAALPAVGSAALTGLGSLKSFLLELAQGTPESIRTLLTGGVESLFSGSAGLVERVLDGLLHFATALLTRIPDSALGFGTWVLASFMISAKLPAIRAFLRRHLQSAHRQALLARLGQLRRSLLRWLAAQLKLMGVTFLVLCIGFLLLRISYAPLWAGLICLVDALPVLGCGTVLAPWSLVCLLQGQPARALGLLGIWGTASLLRTALEPRLVGKQLGLDPLLTLFAMYAGFRLWGLPGMLLSPLAAVTLTQLAKEAPKPKNA